MNLERMLYAQYEQEEAIHGPLPEGRAEQRDLAARFALGVHREVSQYLDALRIDSWLPGDELPRSTRVIELVDILKFTLAMCWTEQVTVAELWQAFGDKTAVVAERFKATATTSKVCGFDLDGVIGEYNQWLPSEREFIESGGCLRIPPVPGAKTLLRMLKDAGWTVVIVTARKVHLYRRLERDTYDWLASNEIPYDRVLWGYDKMEAIRAHGAQLRFFVDDSAKHALDVAEGGIQTYYVGAPEMLPSHRNICQLSSMEAVGAWIRRDWL